VAKKIPRLKQPGIFNLVFIKRRHLQAAAKQSAAANIFYYYFIAADTAFVSISNFLNWHIFCYFFFPKNK
jgi:hypothetical protein